MNLRELAVTGLHEALADVLDTCERIRPDTAVLDLGCGTGAWLERLAERGYRSLCGVDADVTQFGARGIRVEAADLNATDLGLGAERFGLITAIEVLEHVENLGCFFSHIDRHLAPEGLLLLTTPNIQSLTARIRYLLTGRLAHFDARGDPTHVYPIYLPAIERFLNRHGFRVLRNWSYPSAGGSVCSSRKLVLVTRLLRLIVRDAVPGDILCLLVERSDAGRSLGASGHGG